MVLLTQDSYLFLLQQTTWLPLWNEMWNLSCFKRLLGLAIDYTDSADLIAVIFLPLSFSFFIGYIDFTDFITAIKSHC